MGLIVSTATRCTEALEKGLDDLRKQPNKPVSLLIGPDLAEFIVRFGGRL